MSNLEIGVAGTVAVLGLIAARVPIGVALGGVSLLGITAIRGADVAGGMAKTALFEFAASWSLSAVPMFLLMGAIAHHSGISVALFRAARLWLAALPGGLAVAANFACAAFSAASGSSVATAAAMGRIAYPEMRRAGYDAGLSTGVIAAAGTLGSLIPPSILMVLFGIFAETSVSKLLIAGILPGLLTAGVYTAMIVGRCMLNPSLAPRVGAVQVRFERVKALGEVWPILLLIAGIIGGIYGGIFTATEAGAVGAFLAAMIATVQRRLTWLMLRESVGEAVVSSAKIFFVALGAVLMTRFFALSGIPHALGQILTGLELSPVLLLLASSLVYLLLGMFLEPLGLLLITLPLLLPMFQAVGLDMIWVGVLVIKYLEIGLLTPPVGLNIYVVKSVVGDQVPLTTIFQGALWFLACEVVIVALLIAFPEISLVLPSLMN